MRLAAVDNDGAWHWLGSGDGYIFLRSDFGPWGSHKKMIELKVYQTSEGWEAEWFVSNLRQTVANARTHDFIHWKPQTYRNVSKNPVYNSHTRKEWEEATITLNGERLKGYSSEIDKSVLENILEFVAEKECMQIRDAERMKDDSLRFAGLSPLKLSATHHLDKAYPISDNLIGIFFEDINYAADGGLYAEMVQNRDFEYRPTDKNNKDWNSGHSWSLTDWKGNTKTMQFCESNPLHPNNSIYLKIPNSDERQILTNTGFDGYSLHKNENYIFSIFARIDAASHKSPKLNVSIKNKSGLTIAKGIVKLKGKGWKKYEVTLRCDADATEGIMQIEIPEKSGIDLDMISLFPEKTFNNRRNGLRKDLADVLSALKPKFIRFPGGCVAHGDGIDNIYDWKGSIGPVETRKPLRNIWNYHQSRGLGYYEYFLMCEDMGATPLPVLAAGVPCQNSGRAHSGSHDELTSLGQQCGIPMDKMEQYTQDILDLIEYANGDISTEWGAKRAEAGHPAPFGLKYIGIGNEDMITPVFEERFQYIQNRIKAKYPEIRIIGTVGPFYEGSDYEEGWRFAKARKIDMVDEHYYVEPGWFLHHRDFYDEYDRNASHVYLGEYASHIEGRKNNLETALTVGLYLTDIERNGDVVEMTSYAPLLAKKNHINWRPDLIYFTNDSIHLTPDYYVQWLFGNNPGTHYIPTEIKDLDNMSGEIACRVGYSLTRDDKSDDLILKIANLLPVEISFDDKFEPEPECTYSAKALVMAGNPTDECTKPEEKSVTIKDGILKYTAPPYSISVIRLRK